MKLIKQSLIMALLMLSWDPRQGLRRGLRDGHMKKKELLRKLGRCVDYNGNKFCCKNDMDYCKDCSCSGTTCVYVSCGNSPFRCGQNSQITRTTWNGDRTETVATGTKTLTNNYSDLINVNGFCTFY